MLAAVEAALPADVAVFCAAVADWRVEPSWQKIKKGTSGAPSLALIENPDILATIGHHSRRPRLVIGFAAETEKMLEHARAKLARKGCDMIVANDVGGDAGVMGGERNTVHLVTRDGVEDWPTLDKAEVARRLVARMASLIDAPHMSRPAGNRAVLPLDILRLPHARDLPLPRYETEGAAGLDLLAAVDAAKPLRLEPGARALVPCGIVIELPKGHEGQVRPRSGPCAQAWYHRAQRARHDR